MRYTGGFARALRGDRVRHLFSYYANEKLSPILSIRLSI